MLHPYIIVNSSAVHGYGLFTQAAIRRGEICWQEDPRDPVERFTRAEILRWPAERRAAFFDAAWQLDEDTWAYSPGNADSAMLMNHSCDPNTWFEGATRLIARRDIAAGDEITYDYATSEAGNLHLSCRCGALICRGIVTDADHLLPALQTRYGVHIMPHLLQRINMKQPTQP